ncbi:hypothetical protein PG993_002020 [Apiospora rasikravindrae]|uniref:Uncharacterized protein n=1 Tax=Apiospora rasikravindrae TaxID=990691 RepID=A0ABR1UFU9_9PEZI
MNRNVRANQSSTEAVSVAKYITVGATPSCCCCNALALTRDGRRRGPLRSVKSWQDRYLPRGQRGPRGTAHRGQLVGPVEDVSGRQVSVHPLDVELLRARGHHDGGKVPLDVALVQGSGDGRRVRGLGARQDERLVAEGGAGVVDTAIVPSVLLQFAPP